MPTALSKVLNLYRASEGEFHGKQKSVIRKTSLRYPKVLSRRWGYDIKPTPPKLTRQQRSLPKHPFHPFLLRKQGFILPKSGGGHQDLGWGDDIVEHECTVDQERETQDLECGEGELEDFPAQTE